MKAVSAKISVQTQMIGKMSFPIKNQSKKSRALWMIQTILE